MTSQIGLRCHYRLTKHRNKHLPKNAPYLLAVCLQRPSRVESSRVESSRATLGCTDCTISPISILRTFAFFLLMPLPKLEQIAPVIRAPTGRRGISFLLAHTAFNRRSESPSAHFTRLFNSSASSSATGKVEAGTRDRSLFLSTVCVPAHTLRNNLDFMESLSLVFESFLTLCAIFKLIVICF